MKEKQKIVENKEAVKEDKAKPVVVTCKNVKLVRWVNETKEGNTYNSFQIEKFYKDEEGWKTTDSFNVNDLTSLYFLLSEVLENEEYAFKVKRRD